jgi:hypothetical protein
MLVRYHRSEKIQPSHLLVYFHYNTQRAFFAMPERGARQQPLAVCGHVQMWLHIAVSVTSSRADFAQPSTTPQIVSAVEGCMYLSIHNRVLKMLQMYQGLL